MQKVKIIATTHPRLNAGFVYNREEVSGLGTRFTSLGGKHSVFVNLGHASSTVWEHAVSGSPIATPRLPERGFHTEPHVRIGERIAADLWRETYVVGGETVEVCDWVATEFLKRWKEGFFRGEAQA